MNAFTAGLTSRRLRLALLLGVAVFAEIQCVVPASAQQTRTEQISFDILPGALGPALTQWAETANFRLLAPSSALADRTTHGASGILTPAQALGRLLAGSGLNYKFTGPRTVAIDGLSADAAQAGADVPGAVPLETIDVGAVADQSPYGPGVGYVATRSETATKTDTPIIRTPQTISVVTREQMDDQNAQSVPEALRYTSGIVPEQRGTNEDSLEYLYARGFQIDEYLNGLILPGQNEGYNITSVDTYLLDRIELLQGPASVLYGQASPGGILDMQSKRPTDYPLHEIMVQSGNYNRIQGAFDMSDKLNADGTLLGRITGDAFDTDTQTHFIHEKRIAVAPSLTWRPDANTDLTIFANFQDDPAAGIYNSVPAAGTVLPGVHIPRSLDPGDPGFDQFKKIQESIGYSFSHTFDDIWSFDQNFRYLHNEETLAYVAAELGVTPDGQDLVRDAYKNHGIDNTLALDNHAQAKFATGPLSHTVIAGVDWSDTDFFHTLLYWPAASNLNINNPVYFQPVPPPSITLGTSGDQKLDQVGLYTQDQIRWNHWELLAGIREDFADEETIPFNGSATTDQSDIALTWRAGLLYHFDNGVSPYFSYSTSFQPEIGTTISGTPFVPTTGQQYEAGVKYQPPGSNTIVTASAFNLTQQNVLTADPTNASFQVQTGEILSRGVTLEAHTSLTENLNFIGSYTFDDVRNTESTTDDMGKVPEGIPQNLLSAWLTYDLPLQELSGLQLGGGVRYLGSSWGDDENTFKVPAVTLFDAAVHYDLGKRWTNLKGVSLSVTASNIFDKTYISSCLGSTFCTFGEGRLVLANVKYRW